MLQEGRFPTLDRLIKLSSDRAESSKYEFVTIEHFMLGVLEQRPVIDALLDMKVEAAKIASSVEKINKTQYNPQAAQKMLLNSNADLVQTEPLQKFLQTLALNAEASSRQDISSLDCLLHLLETRGDSATFYFLHEGGITFNRLNGYLSEHPELLEINESEMSTVPKVAGISSVVAKSANIKNQYLSCLNDKAGEFDELVGRRDELDRLAQIMARRRKNHALIVGEPGVGKTALIEGLALRIVKGQVPKSLLNRMIYSLDIAGLMVGAKVRGDFEERMRQILTSIAGVGGILLIDNVAALLGSTTQQAGTVDAASLLKPYMAQGRVRIIALANYEEKRNVLDKDKSFMRGFQLLEITEPTKEQVTEILKNLLPSLSKHHEVTYQPETIEAAIVLSERYMVDKFFPDKAIDLLDEAGAKVSSGLITPGVLGIDRALLETITGQLARVNVGAGTTSEKESLRGMNKRLKGVIFGQDEAVDTVTNALILAKAGLNPPTKPLGSFLFTGPTGVGKTELTKQLAEFLGWPLFRYDMSEYMEHHSASRFIGAPPGYVGYEQGAALSNNLLKSPEAVVLLDEVEKAHPDILNLMLQVMDHGTITDGKGQKVDFRRVILVMTSNLGADSSEKRAIGFGDDQETFQREAREKAILSHMPPEFRNRLDSIVHFSTLQQAQMGLIVTKQIAEVAKRATERRVDIEVTPAAVHWLAKNGFDPKMGARPLQRLIQTKIALPLAQQMLFGELEHGGLWKVDIVNDMPVGTSIPLGKGVVATLTASLSAQPVSLVKDA